MIPNQFQQKAPNDYGFNLSKKYNMTRQPYQPRYQFSIPNQMSNTPNNNDSHNHMHHESHYSSPLTFSPDANSYKRSLVIDTPPQTIYPPLDMAQNNSRERPMFQPSQQYKYNGSFGSHKQGYKRNQNISQKQVVTVETMPSVQNLLPLNTSLHIQAFNDLLYKFVGIVSSHTRVKQRAALWQISQYTKQAKSIQRCTDFYQAVNNILKNKLQYAIICIKFNTMHQLAIRPIATNNKKTEKQKSHIVTKKVTRIQQLNDSKFNLQQSAVQKGLKYLQDRANERKRKQQQKIKMRNKNLISHIPDSSYYNYETGQIQTGKFIQLVSDKKLISESDPYLTKQIKNKNNENSNNKSDFKFNNEIPKKAISKNEYANVNHNNFKSDQKKPSAIDQQINNKNMKQASWLAVDVKQNPYASENRKQAFQRYQSNENRYHLNPDTFKESEPDNNDFAMPMQYNFGDDRDYLSQYGIHKNIVSQTTGTNLLEDTLPLFDQSNNQNATKFWEPPHQASHQIHNLIKNAKNTFVNPYIQSIDGNNANKNNQQKLLDSLPSFQKGNHFVNDKTATFQQLQKQRRKSDLVCYNEKDKGSQIRISDQGDYLEMQQQDDQYHFDRKPKRNKIAQYYTQKNIGNKNVRASIDFPKSTKSQRPTSRPKSMTYSIGNESTKQAVSKPINVNQLENKKMNPQFHSGRLQLPQSKNKPKIKINYQSPKHQAQLATTNSMPIIQPYRTIIGNQNMQQVQNRQRMSFYHNFQPQQEIYNKPTRAVSSGCKFFYAQPKQISNTPQRIFPINIHPHQNMRRQQIPLNQNHYFQNQNMNLPSHYYGVPPMNPYYNAQIPITNVVNYPIPTVPAYTNINSPRNMPQINRYQPQMINSIQNSEQQKAYNLINNNQIRKGINVYMGSDPTLSKYNSQKNLQTQNKKMPAQLRGTNKKIHVTTAEQY